MAKTKLMTIISAVGLYLVATGVSYAGFRYWQNPASLIAPVDLETPAEEKRNDLDLSAPKTQACPLNGALFTKAEKDIWSARRPLGVMVENHADSRPQSGLSKADVVYEAVAEGGITRFLSVFLCGAAAEDVQVGPVRSARTYFLDWISEYGTFPLYAHVGGANCNAQTGSGCKNGAKADAIGQINKYGWQAYNDINQFSVGFPTFWRDYDRLGHTVATEHTMYSTTDKLWEVGKERGLTYVDKDDQKWDDIFTPWKFADKEASEKDDQSPNYGFWKNQFANDYAVEWQYDSATNSYLRSNAGKAHMDLDYDKQLVAKNVVVALMEESKANDGYEGNLHLVYKNKGTGKAWVFKDGKAIEATWSKKDRTSRTLFTDATGKEIAFNPGLIWISVVPTGTKVEY